MSKCPEPGDDDYSEAAFFAFGLMVGMRLAREVGLGLPLVNALRDRFDEITMNLAGRIAGSVGQAVRAGVELNFQPPETPLWPEEPAVSGPGLFESADEIERFRVDGIIHFTGDDGEPGWARTIVFANEGDTIADLTTLALDQWFQNRQETLPGGAGEDEISDISIQWFAGWARF